jgi:rubrerythrin
MKVRETSGEWWARVSHQFSTHVREESAFLTQYEELAGRVGDEGIEFLLQLILEDERRHHAFFEEMMNAATTGADGIPAPPAPAAATARSLIEPTERFLEAERDDRAQLRHLRKELKPARDDTLWPLLVELMEIDTEKHIKILEYLRRRLERAVKG